MTVSIKFISKEDQKETARELFYLIKKLNLRLPDQIVKTQECLRILVGVGSDTEELLDEVLKEELHYVK